MMPPPGLKIYLRRRVTLTLDLCIPAVVTVTFTVIRACRIELTFVESFMRYLIKGIFVTYFGLL